MPEFPPPVDPGDPGRGPLIMGFGWTFTILAIIAVGFRFYLRRRFGSGSGWDDWLMFIALVCLPLWAETLVSFYC